VEGALKPEAGVLALEGARRAERPGTTTWAFQAAPNSSPGRRTWGREGVFNEGRRPFSQGTRTWALQGQRLAVGAGRSQRVQACPREERTWRGGGAGGERGCAGEGGEERGRGGGAGGGM